MNDGVLLLINWEMNFFYVSVIVNDTLLAARWLVLVVNFLPLLSWLRITWFCPPDPPLVRVCNVSVVQTMRYPVLVLLMKRVEIRITNAHAVSLRRRFAAHSTRLPD